ncbi:hypothetical protein [Nostoc sp. 'Peltigera membranacea cyanobiont' 232]|uniref:hypothetical protein n=1 Tax=Nostoc sp. 'Peltigera membranacea cyanobiont' 232 TaxID=2014531 RepID=UPI000B95AB00|nr:hypothetical protein [Nostoc sp. 'Peltigera membranacea cyanobiont' 232]OYD99877.1 hypothetical protein CDG79_38340 [Nostoc sp. 'Peltigera membranacea cyanobiont' 232]
MTNHKQVVYQSQLDHKSKLLLRRRTRKRFNPRIFIDRIIETTAIISLLFTGFAGVGAMGCWGMEIATSSQYWQHQKNICLGMMLVSFSGFLASALIGASFSIRQDKF